MSEQPDGKTPDIVELWREWLTQSERQFNAFVNETMNMEPFARTVGGYMEMQAAFQRMTAEGMQRYLSFVNIPSRSDVLGLGETLRAIEDRLERIEEMLQIAAEFAEAPQPGPAPKSEPVRTRRPEGFPVPEEEFAELGAIPEELRR